MLFELSEKGKQHLEKSGYRITRDRNGLEHRFWKWKVAEYYRKRGYRVFIEKPINGNVDVAIRNEHTSIAVEIETGESDFVHNVLKDLRAGFDLVISVATNELVEKRIRAQLAAKRLDKIKRVKVTTVKAFSE